jgi:hypothetical protein
LFHDAPSASDTLMELRTPAKTPKKIGNTGENGVTVIVNE